MVSFSKFRSWNALISYYTARSWRINQSINQSIKPSNYSLSRIRKTTSSHSQISHDQFISIKNPPVFAAPLLKSLLPLRRHHPRPPQSNPTLPHQHQHHQWQPDTRRNSQTVSSTGLLLGSRFGRCSRSGCGFRGSRRSSVCRWIGTWWCGLSWGFYFVWY